MQPLAGPYGPGAAGSGAQWLFGDPRPEGALGGCRGGQARPSVPVTRSSAVLVACPDPLVALRENRPLLAFVTAGIVSLARPSLKEICTPGRVDVEIAWPSLNQLTSGTGKPGAQRQFTVMPGWAQMSPLHIPQGAGPCPNS